MILWFSQMRYLQLRSFFQNIQVVENYRQTNQESDSEAVSLKAPLLLSHSSSPSLPPVTIPVSFAQSPSFLLSFLLWELLHFITKDWWNVHNFFSLNSHFSIKKKEILSHSQRSRISRIAPYDFAITYVSFNSILKRVLRKEEKKIKTRIQNWVFLVDLILWTIKTVWRKAL